MSAQTPQARKSFHEEFAEEIIAGLKNGTAPWVKPWKAGELVPPSNPVSGTVYRGANFLRLAKTGYADPRWMTLKQANTQDWRIRKGSHSMRVVYWQFSKKEPVLDSAGRPSFDEAGNAISREVHLERPLMVTANVFHASQIDGVGEWQPQKPTWEPNARAEAILKHSGLVILHDQRNDAFRRRDNGEIHLPPKSAFPGEGEYYATALHELGHWLCGPERLNLGLKGPFGSESYAREELRVEIAAWMTCMELGLPYQADQHLSYVDSWIKSLENDPFEIVRACRDADHIKQHLLGLELGKELEAPVMQTEQAQAARPEVQQSMPASPSPEKVDMPAREEKTWLAVPYAEKNRAGAAGAKWDRTEKRWFVPAGTELSGFAKWMGERREIPVPSRPAQEEFAARLKEAGLVLEGLPVMDGNLHRVPVAGKENRRDGVYRGYLDGVPNGWFQNHVTGESDKWKHSGHHLDRAQLEQLRAESAKQRELAEQERQEQQERAAKRCYAIWKNAAGWADEKQEYLARKGVPSFGVKVDANGNLLIPGRDANGFIHTLQTVTPDGKRFETGSRKTGMFHTIDPKRSLGEGGKILIAEGYATAASVHLATGLPCVCAFDAGNLIHVARALREQYPDSSLVFMADNDARRPDNPGITKAKLAADEVGGVVLAPRFTQEESARGLTDWNDLHVAHGLKVALGQMDFTRPLYKARSPEKDIPAKGKETSLQLAM